MSSNDLTLSRQDLYELVWSKPMQELAKDFGLSDVALAKRCRRLGVPVPGRGYWARITAGQMPRQPKLPERDERRGDHVALRFREFDPPPTDPEDPLGEEALTIPLIIPNSLLEEAHLIIRRTALAEGHAGAKDLPFRHGDKSGVIVPIDVTAPLLERALLLADTLLRSAEALGWTLEPAPAPTPDPHNRREPDPPAAPNRLPAGDFTIHGERVAFGIEERMRIEPREPTAAELAREKREYSYHAPRKQFIATGKLRVVRFDATSYLTRRKSWPDRVKRPVEECIPEILQSFRNLAQRYQNERVKREQEEREAEEWRRLQEARQKRREANAKLILSLETHAGAWHRARYLRRYVRALRRASSGRTINVMLGEERIDFMAWAEQYLNQLDPLHDEPRHPDMAPDPSPYYRTNGDTEDLQKSLANLTGQNWLKASKLNCSSSASDETDDG